MNLLNELTGRVAPAAVDDWSKQLLFSSIDAVFKPNETVGLKNIPDSFDANSKPSDFLSLFWTDELWELFVMETNRQAVYIATDKADKYYSKSFEPITVTEMKAFFDCRIAMEMLVHKDI